MKFKLYFIIIFIFAFLTGNSLFAQDPGNRDTLFVHSSGCNFVVSGYHDEPLSGIKIPLRYKTNQTDILLDSVRFHPDVSGAFIRDTVIDRDTGKVTFFAIWSDSLPAGIDTFMLMFFTPGPTWNPTVYNPIDTFRFASGAGLSFTDVNLNDITPHYDPPGAFSSGCTDVKDDYRFPSTLRPSDFTLFQNFPNPFNSETVITFALPRSSDVKIEIFNILGQKIRDLVDEELSAGYKKVVWDGRDNNGKTVASGVYFYQLKAGGLTKAKRMILLK